MADAGAQQKESAAYVVVQNMTYKSKAGGERMVDPEDEDNTIPAGDISKADAEIFLSLGYMKEKGGK
jgi:hypothetical protein